MSYRILRVERGRVRVEDAQGAPPTIPFWLGEAPGRSDELSFAVSRLRQEISDRLDALKPFPSGGGVGRDGVHDASASIATGAAPATAEAWLVDDVGLAEAAAHQIVDYLGSREGRARRAADAGHELAMERFFDESGGTQLIIHSPLRQPHQPRVGAGAAQALLPQVQFRTAGGGDRGRDRAVAVDQPQLPARGRRRATCIPTSVRDVLIQALLDAPMFGVRWRWNATAALALPRFQGGAKVPPQLQRMKAEDLLATRVSGSGRVRSRTSSANARFPTIRWSSRPCTTACTSAMDIDGLGRAAASAWKAAPRTSSRAT